jgi:hypothetical protein
MRGGSNIILAKEWPRERVAAGALYDQTLSIKQHVNIEAASFIVDIEQHRM